MSNTYLAADMKWSIHTSTRHKTQSRVTINSSIYIDCTANNKIKVLPYVLSRPAFSHSQQYNRYIITVWNCTSTVYKPQYSIPGLPVSSGSDPSSSPYEWKHWVHLFNGKSWKRKVKSWWSLRIKSMALGQNCQCTELHSPALANIYM